MVDITVFVLIIYFKMADTTIFVQTIDLTIVDTLF